METTVAKPRSIRRKLRRERERDINKPKYSLTDVQKAINIAIVIRKYNKGHLFKKENKDKCVFCGAGTKTKTKCKYWFFTFLDRMQVVLINPEAFTDKEIEALYLTHGEEYQDIKLPLI